MPESCYMEESYLWFLFFAKIFSNYFLSISGDYLLASVLCKCSTAFDICQILNHSIQSHSNIVRKRTEFVGITVPFLLLTLFLDRHVMVPEIKFWTQVSSTNWKKAGGGGKYICRWCLQVFASVFYAFQGQG